MKGGSISLNTHWFRNREERCDENVIDWKELEDRIGNEELITKIVSVFLEEYNHHIEKFSTTIEVYSSEKD